MSDPANERRQDPASVRASEFMRLWTHHARQIYSYILSLLPRPNDAEEIFQEVSTVMWEKFDEFEAGTNFRAWACRIAYYKVVHFNQRRHRRPMALENSFLETVDRLTVERADDLDLRFQYLADCYDALKPRDRDLIDRRYNPGATTRDVAKQVGRSVDAIYKALTRIHHQLLECINRRAAEGDRL